MKKTVSLILSVVFVFPLFAIHAKGLSAYDLSAECAALMCVQTGELLYQKNAHETHAMASTTKIMTSLLALEEQTPRRVIHVKASMLKTEGTSMGLLDGDSVTLEGLVYGMLLQSGNDAANVTAYALAGSPERFARRMNTKAHEIGMTRTSFVTPSGLDDTNHYSTAYDMALLGCCAVRNPEFLHICAQKQATVAYGNPPYARVLTNHNRLLSLYDGALGIKTGFTKKSGRCLVSCAERGGVTLVAVTLNAPGDWADHARLLDYGFSVVRRQTVCAKPFRVRVVGGTAQSVQAAGAETTVCGKSFTEKRFVPAFLYAPVHAGDVIGEVRYYADGRQVASAALTAQADVPAQRAQTQPVRKNDRNLFQRIAEILKEKRR